MSVRAPGKVMIAGEYAVLFGAPALVAAVTRYATAQVVAQDSQHAMASDRFPEARAALDLAVARGPLRAAPAVSIDVDALRSGGQKLGLGSSAAAAVASLGAALLAEGRELRAMQREIADIVRSAHRSVQGGGSGADVYASALGGLIAFRFSDAGESHDPVVQSVPWADGVPWCVLWTGQSVRTSDFVARVRDHARSHPNDIAQYVDTVTDTTRALQQALGVGAAADAVQAVRRHGDAMRRLGDAVGLPIVTPSTVQLTAEIEPLGAAVKPSGAGGGDIVLLIGENRSTLDAARAVAERRGFVPVDLQLDLAGVHAVPPPSS